MKIDHALHDAIALATMQVCTRVAEQQCIDPRIVAIGLVHALPAEGGGFAFDIDAIAMDPARPSEEIATVLAKWLLGHFDGTKRMIAWNITNPLIAGLEDIGRKVEPELAQALMNRLKARAAIDVAVPFTLFGPVRLAEAARSRSIDFIQRSPAGLEPADEAQCAYRRDVVATAAMATWRLWVHSMRSPPTAHLNAKAALSGWRQRNRGE